MNKEKWTIESARNTLLSAGARQTATGIEVKKDSLGLKRLGAMDFLRKNGFRVFWG